LHSFYRFRGIGSLAGRDKEEDSGGINPQKSQNIHPTSSKISIVCKNFLLLGGDLKTRELPERLKIEGILKMALNLLNFIREVICFDLQKRLF
jgi:hypothetical protein